GGNVGVKGRGPSFCGAGGAPRRTRCRRWRHRGLQKLPGIGSGRRLVDMDVWNDRSADEQRALLSIAPAMDLERIGISGSLSENGHDAGDPRSACEEASRK